MTAAPASQIAQPQLMLSQQPLPAFGRALTAQASLSRPAQPPTVPRLGDGMFYWPASMPLKPFIERVDGEAGVRVVDIEAIKTTDVGKQAFPWPCTKQ